MSWTISAWVIALLSLIVNSLQLLNNLSLKKELSNKTSQKTGSGSKAIQQTHSGVGNNMNIGGDGTINT